ncbi:phosphoglycerate dehydrogenase [Gracilinema caldarium]|uniref:phosphoglycerate dehydrogenase n=1 Tax=Gracilinema caldarium TaxID=215591 RepID=UPI0026F155D7|nr:phosphoglycerate dehydrogenase [Gracilinema caldarium]
MTHTVLLLDSLPDWVISRLESLGCTVIVKTGVPETEHAALLREVNPRILIVRSTKVSRAMIEAASDLSLIIRSGAGYNTIDVAAASERSIYVSNCPGKNAIAVAELAMGLILALDRRIPDNVNDLRQGLWNKKEYSKAQGLYGRTLAVIGTGNIGKEVIQRAKAFGLHVIAYSRSLTPEAAEALGAVYAASIIDAVKGADIVSLHLALAPELKGVINAEVFGAMKEGALFINTSRAELVDEAALLKAITEKKLKVATDVYPQEPEKSGPFQTPLAAFPQVYGTHHIGASTEQAQNAVAEETVRIVKEYLQNGQVPNCVNVMEKTPARYLLSVRHKDKVGVLANILRVIRDNNINVQRMENIIFAGAQGACANIQIEKPLSQEQLAALTGSGDDIYEAIITELKD